MNENILQNNERELLLALRRGDLSSERAKEHWSDEERENLRRMYAAEGTGVSKIALIFRRSENAIYQQLTSMSLLTTPGKERRTGTRKNKCRCPRCSEFACEHYNAEEGSCCLINTMKF